MTNYKIKQEDFMKTWLSGTTCYRKCKASIKWTDDSGRFIVAYHHSHIDYVDRMSGSKNCEVTFVLYDLDKISDGSSLISNHKYIKKWKGRRWSKLLLKEIEYAVQEEIANV